MDKWLAGTSNSHIANENIEEASVVITQYHST